MKRRLHRLLWVFVVAGSLAGSPVARADLQRFESADGTKSFYAELLRFDHEKKIVTVRKVNGREVSFRLSALSEKSQKWVDGQKEILAAGRSLKLKLAGQWGDRTVAKGATSKTITSQRIYTAELVNYGSLPLQDLEVTYDYHVFRDDGKGGATSVVTHKEQVSYLGSASDWEKRLAPVTLSQTVPLSSAGASGGG